MKQNILVIQITGIIYRISYGYSRKILQEYYLNLTIAMMLYRKGKKETVNFLNCSLMDTQTKAAID